MIANAHGLDLHPTRPVAKYRRNSCNERTLEKVPHGRVPLTPNALSSAAATPNTADHPASASKQKHAMLRRALLTFALLSPGLPALAQFQPVTCKNAYTRDGEIAEGGKVVAQVYQTMPVLPDSDPVSRFVQGVGARLVAVAPQTPGLEQQWPFRFHVVASSEINAFALPGGTMFVNLGAVQAAETEAQLAGVMAHEMSHVILRHSTCNLTRQRKRSIFYSLGQIGAGLALGSAGGLAAQGIGAAQSLDFLHMSRGDEQQADLLGVHIAHDAGYDPRGLPQFFEIIVAKYGQGGAQFLSDHPNPGNRTEYVNREIALLPPLDHPIKSTPAFAQAHTQAASEHALTAAEMKSGTWRNSGLYASSPSGAGTYTPVSGTANAPGAPGTSNSTAGAVARVPAAQFGLRERMVPVQLPSFALRAPANWRQVPGAGTNGSVTLAPPGGAGSFGVAYGTVLGLVRQNGDGITDNASLAAATEALTRQLVQAQGLTLSGAPTPLQVGGQLALSRDLRATSPVRTTGAPEPEHDRLVTVMRPDGDLDYMIFVAPESDFATLRPVFESMLASFRPQ